MWWSFAAADATEAEWLRSAFGAYLRARGAEDADYYSAELIFGELVGNVVRHAPGPIVVDVRWTGEAPVLSVTDRGPGFALRAALPQDVLAESGRGLFLVNAFSDGVTVEPNPGGGTRVSVVLRIRRKAQAPAATRGQREPAPQSMGASSELTQQ